MGLFKEITVIMDLAGAPTGSNLTSAESKCQKIELDNPGVIIHTKDKNGVDQPPRKKP